MGTITTRKRRDGTTSHTAQIRIRRNGELVHTESQTFDRKQAASIWLKKRESELAEPGALDALLNTVDPTLAYVIDQYITESRRPLGKTKTQVLRTIKGSKLAQMKCSEIGSPQIMEFARSLKVQPQTVGNYLSHLAAVFAVARPAWGYPLSKQAVDDARVVAKKIGAVTRGRERDRRPTLDELERLLERFSQKTREDNLPMVDLTLFALFSTRRLDEICRITWEDLDRERSEVLVRDMKNPGEKIGNNVRCTLPPEALAVILRQPTTKGRIFPFNSKSVSSNFTRTCKVLGIEDLHMHDLRHEGISRLFELGWNIPQAACVSGHRTWTSLKRYTHIRQSGDKYAGWKWNPLAPAAQKETA